MAQSLHSELVKCHQAYGVEDMPLPINESDVAVRCPAWFDGREAWQGATFIQNVNGVRVQLDTGSWRDFPNVSSAWSWMVSSTDTWEWVIE